MESNKFKMRFYKQENKWYVDLPNWTGDQDALQMVAGADTMLDIYSNNGDEVLLSISKTPIENYDKLEFVSMADDMGEGAYYVMKKHGEEVINLEMWLCAVTLFVFDEYPKELFIKKTINQ